MSEITYKDLVNYRNLKTNLTLLKEQIEECNAMIYDISAQKFTQEVRSGTKKVDKIGQLLAKAEGLKERYTSEMNECINQMEKITDALKVVKDSEHRRVIYLHYIKGMTVESIMDEMNMSWNTVYRYRLKALKDLGLSDC